MLSSTLQINLYFNVLINEEYFKVNVYIYYSVPYFSFGKIVCLFQEIHIYIKEDIFTVISIDTFSNNM